jgi:hypothetical protein
VTEPGQSAPTGGFLGTLLIVLGILWMLTAGACTGLFVIGGVAAMFRNGVAIEAAPALGVWLAIGLVCITPGLGLFLLGRAIRRR